MSRQKIKEFIELMYSDTQLEEYYDEIVYSGEYLDEDWQTYADGFDDEAEWYEMYGGGEAQTQIVDEIVDAIANEFFDGSIDFYFKETYGDIDALIYDCYPILEY